MVTPLAKSMLITQSSQMSTIPDRITPVRDIVEPISNEQARAKFLEKQMRQIGSMSKVSSDMPSLEEVPICSPGKRSEETISERECKGNIAQPQMGIDGLQARIQNYCWEDELRKKQEWESHKMILVKMKEDKEQLQHQQSQEE